MNDKRSQNFDPSNSNVEISFPNSETLPDGHIILGDISNKELQKIYNIFKFHSIDLCLLNDDEEIKKILLYIIHKSKFLTYQTHKMQKNENEIVICVEKNCFIIKLLNIDLFFNVLKGCDSLIINTNKSNDICIQINNEIISMYNMYKSDISKNKLLQCTYRSVFCYIIRRNYCPSSYFNDKKFFSFDEYLKENQIERNQLIKFTENDFIKLRGINSSGYKIIFLAFHIDSQCLLVMKEIYNSEQKTIKRKMDFFQKYSHRCLIKCYGYIECEQYHIFIIDFMSNESISKYMDNHKIDFYFSFMSMIRIFESISYLHSQHLIHRDLNPQNVVLNHDYVPYLCDFEYIRSGDDDDKDYTLDFGTDFSSPEQIKNIDNRIISYPTDIYSFGLLVYFLFEKKIIKDKENLQNLSFVNTPKKMQDLVLNCVKYSQEERPKKEEIEETLIEMINSYYYFEPSFIKENFKKLRKDYIDLFLKESIELFSQEACVDKVKMNLKNTFSTLLEEKDVVSFIHKLGEGYKNGQFGKADYQCAKELFEISSKHGNSDSLIEIGKFYRDGVGVDKDYKIAKQYFEESIQMNNSFGYIFVGNLYFHGQGVDQSYEKAKEYYEKSANMGNSEGFNGLAFLYLRGNGVEKNVSTALKYFSLSAEKNNSYAAIYLANIYYHGVLEKQDYYKAKKYYEQSVELGNSEGLIGLGALYLKGLGVEKDTKKAIELYEKAAMENNCNAFVRLGNIYFRGYGMKRDYAKAKEYYQMSAEKGNSDALFLIGCLYMNGFGVERNFEETKKYFEMAEKKNNKEAIIGLGFLYKMGFGVKRDFSKAKEYFEKATSKKYTVGYIYIGNLYYNKQDGNQDFSKAKEYYEKAYQYGQDSKGLLYKGLIYYYGLSVAYDYKKALSLFKKAAEVNNSDALVYIGNCHFNGFGVEKDTSKAIEYYESAVQKDNLKALKSLGKIYLEGADDIKPDYTKSRQYFEKLLEVRNSDAYYYIGLMYYKGFGVEQNYKIAREYFEYSVYYFNKKALFYLGRIYENGEGVFVDLNKAIEYYKECANNHDEIFIYFSDTGWNEDINNNIFYYCSNNDLGLIYFTENLNVNINEAVEYIKKAGHNEYPFGQNNLGLYYEFYMKQIENAKHFYERSSKHNFSLSEFNLGRLNKNDSIRHYNNAIKYEIEPLIFQRNQYFDERLEISKSFITCLSNLKILLYKMNQNEIEQSFFFDSLFKPVFKFLFNDEFQSFSFNLMIKINNDNSIKTNFQDFILSFPLFNILNQNEIKDHYVPSNEIWRLIENNSSNNEEKCKEIIIRFSIDNNRNNNEKALTIDNSVNENRSNEELNHIFNNYNNKKLFKIKESSDDDKDNMKEFVFTKIDDNSERKLKYSINLFNFIFMHIKDIEYEIREIVKIMENIIYTQPYSILFGRIKTKNIKEKQIDTRKNIDDNFLEGLNT